MLELRRIGQCRARCIRQHDIERHLRANQAAEHRGHAADDIHQIHQSGLQHLSFGVGQQLSGQPRSLRRSFGDHGQRVAIIITQVIAGEQHLDRDRRYREQIVEVMGNAAGQPTDGFEALRFLHARFIEGDASLGLQLG